jgi:hypothetical protein
MLCVTMQAAVFEALDEIKDKTSGPELLKVAKRYYEYMGLTLSACYQARLKWRKMKGRQQNDCRTNETQHRRNMLNDSQFTSKGWKLLTKVLTATNFKTVATLLEEFHSIDQLRGLVSDMQELKKAA